MKKILQYLLKFFSSLVLKKYKPEIIAITGSVGKTSTKEVVAQMLSNRYKLWKSKNNFNNEIGIPLTILGFDKSPNKSIIGWLGVFLKAIKMILIKNRDYPEKLVLEMGADHIGDIEYLVGFIPVKISVITKISKAHIEHFKTISAIFKEKVKIFKNLPSDGYAIINNDDERLRDYKSQLKCRTITYAIKNDADVQATDLQIIRKNDFIGMNFKIRYSGNVVPIFLPGAFGWSQVYAFLAGSAVCLVRGINLVEISIFANKYFSPRGRTNLLKSINNGYILDDTYNSSPEAVKVAIDLLADLKTLISGRKIVVLGDMLELGEESEDLHKQIGEYIAKKENIDYILTLGDQAKNIAKQAILNGFKENNCLCFEDREKLVDYLKSIMISDGIVLVKGSQGARMERIVKEIMRDRHLSNNLLVRQDSSWSDR